METDNEEEVILEWGSSSPSDPDIVLLPPDDFRRERAMLHPSVFVFGPTRVVAPTDRISEEVWRHATSCPDDVAISTSSHCGSVVDAMAKIASLWLDATFEPLSRGDGGYMDRAAIIAHEELEAAVFMGLHGWYRQGVSCLRNVIEVLVHSAAFSVRSDVTGLQRWSNGIAEPAFGVSCRELHESPIGQSLRSAGYAVFGVRKTDDAWARVLYGKICKFAHSAGGAANADLWDSNGPVYRPDALTLAAALLQEVTAFGFTVLSIGAPDWSLPLSRVRALVFDPGGAPEPAAALIRSARLLE